MILPYTPIYRIRREIMCKPMEVGQTLSGCSSNLLEEWMEVCVEPIKSCRKAVEVDGNPVDKSLCGSSWKSVEISDNVWK